MSRISYVSGRYLRHADARTHVEDRGYQFADGVYEACEVRQGVIIDLTRHLDRLDRSLAALRIKAPMARGGLVTVIREVLRRNRVVNGLFYLQVSRGVARRDHFFPTAAVAPVLVVTARSTDRSVIERKNATGIKAITVPDNRWERVDIKTVGLLPNVLARQAAREAGTHDAIFVDAEDMVTEGASSNVWIVDQEGRLVTRPADRGILRGITRTTAMDVAAALQIPVVERRFSRAEMLAAREVFLTAATSVCFPVVEIDGVAIGNGHPGSTAEKLRAAFFDIAEKTPI